jgi:hypothetical protein
MAQFIKCTQNGGELDFEVDNIDLVRAVPPAAAAPTNAGKGYLEIFLANRLNPVILTANVDIQAFYTAFYPVAYPSVAVPTTTLGS